MSAARDDLYAVLALLGDIDRVLSPLPPAMSDDLSTPPAIPPPLPPAEPGRGPRGGSGPPPGPGKRGAAASAENDAARWVLPPGRRGAEAADSVTAARRPVLRAPDQSTGRDRSDVRGPDEERGARSAADRAAPASPTIPAAAPAVQAGALAPPPRSVRVPDEATGARRDATRRAPAAPSPGEPRASRDSRAPRDPRGDLRPPPPSRRGALRPPAPTTATATPQHAARSDAAAPPPPPPRPQPPLPASRDTRVRTAPDAPRSSSTDDHRAHAAPQRPAAPHAITDAPSIAPKPPSPRSPRLAPRPLRSRRLVHEPRGHILDAAAPARPPSFEPPPLPRAARPAPIDAPPPAPLAGELLDAALDREPADLLDEALDAPAAAPPRFWLRGGRALVESTPASTDAARARLAARLRTRTGLAASSPRDRVATTSIRRRGRRL